MYPFSCVLWAKMPQKLIPNHRTVNSKTASNNDIRRY